MLRKVLLLGGLLVAAVAALVAAAGSEPRPAVATPRLKLVFAALDRDASGNAGGLQALYVANGDGTNVARLTPPGDGRHYDWPMWGPDGKKIYFTARDGVLAGGAEPVYVMDVENSQIVQLTHNTWRNGQPKPSPDGQSVVFTSMWKEFPVVGLYKLWLATGEVENLSARHATDSGFDSDPFWTVDGKGIVFASTRSEAGLEQPTQIYVMNADGAGRRRLTHDQFFNTDPSLSPDGRYLTTSSYRGTGRPALNDEEEGAFNRIKLRDWPLVVLDTETGVERVLAQGKDCTQREITNPCTPTEGSAWVPKWSPDGKQIGYISILAPDRSGIYVIDADGRNARPIIETADKAITWFDWIEEPAPQPVQNILPQFGASALLFSGRVYDKLADGQKPPDPQLFAASSDRWFTKRITPARSDIVPDQARWSADKRHILFTARVKLEDGAAPVAGSSMPARRMPRTLAATLDGPEASAAKVVEQQVFVMPSDGSWVHQLTTPRTEDALAPIPDGERRGNTDPDLSPDGRYVVFVNRAETTGETWILRYDFHTGEIINLSSISRGPFGGVDERPRWSPDGAQISFTAIVQDVSQVFVMSADGQNVRQLTDDLHQNLDPAWSPDGRWLVYVSERLTGATGADGKPLAEWFLVKLNVETREQVVLAGGKDFEPFRPVWSPDGTRIAFIAVTQGQQPDIYVVDAAGGSPRPLQVTLLTKEAFLDWR